MSDHVDPMDKISALEWAVKKAEEQPVSDPLAQLNLFVLRKMRDEAIREARR